MSIIPVPQFLGSKYKTRKRTIVRSQEMVPFPCLFLSTPQPLQVLGSSNGVMWSQRIQEPAVEEVGALF